MQNLVTIEWIETRDTRDTRGLIVDSTSLEDAIVSISNRICDYVGHDFGDSTSIESIDGVQSSMLLLNGLTKYPLRSYTTIKIDDCAVPATNLILRPNRQLGDLKTSVRLKVGNWDGYTVTIDGLWGWQDIPEDVKEAVYRLLVLELTGTSYSSQNSGNDKIKRLKHPDGVEIEFHTKESTLFQDPDDLGDDYANNVLRKYRWIGIGGVA